MTGTRRDAVEVIDKTEFPKINNPWSIYWSLKVSELESLFDLGLFCSAEKSITVFEEKFSIPEKEKEINRAKKLARSFDAWDRFEHKNAYEILDEFRTEYLTHLIFLERILNKRKDATGYEKVNDLIGNAERREKIGHYDDAICRLYRAIEMLAQLRLKNGYNIDSSDVDLSKLPSQSATDYCLSCQREDGTIKLSLNRQYRLLKILNDPIGKIYSECENELKNFLRYRNQSILAHGETPVSRRDYQKAKEFALNFICKCFEAIGVEAKEVKEFPFLKFKKF